MRTSLIGLGVVALLLGGAYLAVAPWIDCATPLHTFIPDAGRICAFGTGIAAFDATGPGPYWPRLVLGLGYGLAALWIGLSRRMRFD